MIIYGTRAVSLDSFELTAQPCENCGTEGSLVLTIFRKHAHIFWIPMVPLGKKGVSVCTNCKNTLKVSEMPEPLKMEYQSVKNSVKGPIWQFTGLVLVLLLASFIWYENGENQKEELIYLSSPAAGDIYYLKLATGEYTTLKVMTVSQDSVFVVANEFVTNKPSGNRKLNKPENYSADSYGIARTYLIELHQDGDLYTVSR